MNMDLTQYLNSITQAEAGNVPVDWKVVANTILQASQATIQEQAKQIEALQADAATGDGDKKAELKE